MLSLDSRKVRILHTVVEDYVLTTRPVGSERLIELCCLDCKSATIRNEMAEMADMGLLAQPHTSAGRIPTDQGYRFYVDELMDENQTLTSAEKRSSKPSGTEVESLMQHTCRILSRLTSYTSIATDPVTNTTHIRRVYLEEADARHLLLVALLSTGHVEHHLIDVEQLPDSRSLIMLCTLLNEQLAGEALENAAQHIRGASPVGELKKWTGLLRKVEITLQQASLDLYDQKIYLEGASHLLRQPEFHDVLILESLLNALEQQGALHKALYHAMQGKSSSVMIGSENQWSPMKSCSVVTSGYQIGHRVAGYLGVVGPTRMQYGRAVAAVHLMANNLSNALTNLSMA